MDAQPSFDYTPSRETYRDAVAALFRRRPRQWIAWHEIAKVGGAMAWRTRVSDCRREFGMSITPRIRRTVTGQKVSEYIFVPKDAFREEKQAEDRVECVGHADDYQSSAPSLTERSG